MRDAKVGDTYSDNELKLEFKWCPEGSFRMGSPETEKFRNEDEKQVDVKFESGFWLGKTEVTQRQWMELMKTTPWKGKELTKVGDDIPATNVDFDQVRAFCERLSEIEKNAGRLPVGWKYILPTESQWEYACRAGSEKAYCFGDDESLLNEFAWWGEGAGDIRVIDPKFSVHEVAQKKPNSWGLYDMHGNVIEWCDSIFRPRFQAGDERSGEFYSCRGGGWLSQAGQCRSAHRGGNIAKGGCADVGFRVALVKIDTETVK